MRHLPVFVLASLALGACGGTTASTGDTTARTAGNERCEISRRGEVTFLEDTRLGFGFSLPPPAAWTLECIEEEGRLVRGHNDEVDAAVSVSVDPQGGSVPDATYLRTYVREVRGTLRERGLELTNPRYETHEGSPIGVMEVRAREEGETSVHVAAFSVLRTESGGWLRFMVILPTEGRFGHRDADPMVRRAVQTALSFGSLE